MAVVEGEGKREERVREVESEGGGEWGRGDEEEYLRGA